LLALAGFTAGCSGWTKNEGLPFMLALSVIFLVSGRFRRFAVFLSGMFLPLLAIVLFKIMIAPPSDLMSNRHYAEVVEKLFDPGRHLTILTLFSDNLWSFGDFAVHPLIPLLLLMLFAGLDRQSIGGFGWIASAGALSVQVASYFAVYAITPMDVKWHLENSLPRILLQVWPAFLLLAGLAMMTSSVGLRRRSRVVDPDFDRDEIDGPARQQLPKISIIRR
jgi:hypothetical protein